MDTENPERHSIVSGGAWGRYVAAERGELEKRKAGHVGRLLGCPPPCESAEEDRERAGRGLVQLREGEHVWWKLLHELTEGDRPARLEAKRVFARWLSDRHGARPL